jgi:HEAT repeat protein
LIHRYQAELPRQRCKLYEKAVETLLTSWDSGKEIKLYSQVLLFLKSDDLLYILKKLAYWIHTQGSTGETEGGTLIDNDELIRWLRQEIQTLKKCEAHEAKGEAERFIDFIQRRTGLLNEQGRDRYAFVHKTFQEYLTAEEIFDRADVEDDTEIILAHFRQHLHDQHWREVLLLLVSKLKGKKAQKAIQAVLDSGSEYEQWLHRDLLFAGWCLTEDPPELTVVAADWVGGILDRLVELEVGNSDRIGRKISGEVDKILHCFGETTVERDVLAKLQAQGDRIDHFRLLQFQAALGQEAEAMDTLLSSLQDESLSVRYYAARALGQLGNTQKEVISSLLILLGDHNSNISSIAAEALGQLGCTSPEVVSSLLYLLKDKNSTVRSSAAIALGQLGITTEQVVNNGLLPLLLGDENSDVRSSVADVLGQLGNANIEVMKGLISSLDDQNSLVRANAAAALLQIGNTSDLVVNRLFSLLRDESSILVSLAVYSLSQLVNIREEVINKLLPLLEDESPTIYAHAAVALVRLGNTSPAVVSALLSLLNNRDIIVHNRLTAALGQLSKTSDTILTRVVQLLEQKPNYYGIGNAIDCLWSIVVE